MKLLIFIVLMILLYSCTDQNHQENAFEIHNINDIPILKLKEEFKISEFNEDLFFGYVSNVVTGSNGTIFVSDPTTQRIYLFSDKGAYNGFLGGQGSGPGEFRRISNMFLLTPDTLQVLDITSARLTYFTLDQNEWVLTGTIDYPKNPGIGSDDDIFGFRKFYRFENGYIGVFESTISSFESDTDNFITFCFVSYNENFELNRNITPLCFDRIELVVHQSTNSNVQTVSAIPVPGGFQTFYAISTGGNIVTTWTEDPILSIQSITNRDPVEFEYQSSEILLTHEMKLDLVKKFLPNEEQSNLQRSRIFDLIPEYKGFASQLLIDDNDQIWILANSQDHKPEWLIYDFNGNLRGRTLHPGGNFMQVKNNKIYVAQNSVDAEPSFSVYSIGYQ